MQTISKILITTLLSLQITSKAIDLPPQDLTADLIDLKDELEKLAEALSSQKTSFTPTPKLPEQPKPSKIATGHTGLEAIGERILPNGKKIIVGVGDVEKIDNVDAVMNAANAHLQFGTGVAGSIAKALGSEGVKQVYAEIKAKYKTPVQVGSATPTAVPADTTLSQRGFKYIIHAVGPDCRVPAQEQQWQILLGNAYKNSLIETAKLNLTSMTVPPLSIGVFSCDYTTALNVMMGTIVRFLLSDTSTLQEVILVVWAGGKNPEKTAQGWLQVVDRHIQIAN